MMKPRFKCDKSTLAMTHHNNSSGGPDLRDRLHLAGQQRRIRPNTRAAARRRLANPVAVKGEFVRTKELEALVAEREDDRALPRDCVEHERVRISPGGDTMSIAGNGTWRRLIVTRAIAISVDFAKIPLVEKAPRPVWRPGKVRFTLRVR